MNYTISTTDTVPTFEHGGDTSYRQPDRSWKPTGPPVEWLVEQLAKKGYRGTLKREEIIWSEGDGEVSGSTRAGYKTMYLTIGE